VKRDKIFDHLKFTPNFTVEDWNQTLNLTLRKYFINEKLFISNKEVLRTELVNYIRISQDREYFDLFEWTYKLLKDSVASNQQETIAILAEFFYETSGTDLKWMTNVLTQPDTSEFSEHDKISYYFKVIEDVLESAFKPRFKLLWKFAQLQSTGTTEHNFPEDFGQLINDFPKKFVDSAHLYIKDPIFSIPTNQWRNIAAHKSFKIDQQHVVVEYGRKNRKSITIDYHEFYRIFDWTQKMYRALRLAEILINLNYIKEIVAILGGTEKIRSRFEALMLHLVHNMQIVGFEFVSTEKHSISILNQK
jgi:hypothetical protein